MGTGSGAEGIMLGTAPASATDFLTITRDGSSTGGIKSDSRPLPGTGFQAVAIDFDDPSGPDGYLDTIWTNPPGEVRDARGTRLPSTTVAGGDTFFVARDAGQVGAFTRSGGVLRPLSAELTTTLGYGEALDNGGWVWRSVTLLPAGSTFVTFTSAYQDWVPQVLVEPFRAAREHWP